MSIKDCLAEAVRGGVMTQTEANDLGRRYDALGGDKAALAAELSRAPVASAPVADLIVAAKANPVKLNEVSYARDDAFDVELQSRMEEWREEQRAQGRFEALSRRDADSAIDEFLDNKKARDPVNSFLKENDADPDAHSADNYEDAYQALGVKITVGNVPVWSEYNGNWFIVEAPNGRALIFSEFDSNPEVHASKVEAIKSINAEGARATRDLLANESEVEAELRQEIDPKDPTKWSRHSLDPSNPSYRETVIHLPERDKDFANSVRAGHVDPADAQSDFYAGHFSEPNIVGHMMTSMVKHEGRPVYLIDQIQSDWGQKIRDGGYFDEAKIKTLADQVTSVEDKMEAMRERYIEGVHVAPAQQSPAGFYELQYKVDGDWKPLARRSPLSQLELEGDLTGKTFVKRTKVGDQEMRLDSRRFPEYASLASEYDRLRAEWQLARTTDTPGNPLVNTTDQWTTTTLRRAIRQAAEADADYIAIPSGDTVLSYNPGDTNGMVQFYGRTQTRQTFDIGPDLEPVATGQSRGTVEGIVPKNLRNILSKIDKNSPKPQKVATLDTPSKGAAGKGFTLFELTDVVKASVLDEGQPLFAMGGVLGESVPKRANGGRVTAPEDPPPRALLSGIFDKEGAISRALRMIRRTN